MFISLTDWQSLVARSQELAARYSELGIKPDTLALMRLDELIRNYNFLKRFHAENGV